MQNFTLQNRVLLLPEMRTSSMALSWMTSRLELMQVDVISDISLTLNIFAMRFIYNIKEKHVITPHPIG